MGIAIGNINSGRIWNGNNIIRVSAIGPDIFYPRGCGAVLPSLERIGDATVFQSTYQWTHSENLNRLYNLNEGDPALELRSVALDGRHQPYIYVRYAVSNVKITDFIATMVASENSTWRWLPIIVRSSATNYLRENGSILSGTTNYDVPIAIEVADQVWDTGPLGEGALIFPCCFASYGTPSLVIGNISWSATATA